MGMILGEEGKITLECCVVIPSWCVLLHSWSLLPFPRAGYFISIFSRFISSRFCVIEYFFPLPCLHIRDSGVSGADGMIQSAFPIQSTRNSFVPSFACLFASQFLHSTSFIILVIIVLLLFTIHSLLCSLCRAQLLVGCTAALHIVQRFAIGFGLSLRPEEK
jgi:hypothetical protein